MDTSETVSCIYEYLVYDKGSILNELKNDRSLMVLGKLAIKQAKTKLNSNSCH